MPGRVSKAVRTAVCQTINSLVSRGQLNASNPYKSDTRAYKLFARLYPKTVEAWKIHESLHDDMMYTMYGVFPDDPDRTARLLGLPAKLPLDESPSNDGDSIRPGGSVCFAIPDRISDGGDTE